MNALNEAIRDPLILGMVAVILFLIGLLVWGAPL